MSNEDIRVAIFGCALIFVFWGLLVPLTQCKWFRRLLTGWDGHEKHE